MTLKLESMNVTLNKNTITTSGVIVTVGLQVQRQQKNKKEQIRKPTKM